jgi:hypothetical protein
MYPSRITFCGVAMGTKLSPLILRGKKLQPKDQVDEIRLKLIPSQYPKQFQAVRNLRALSERKDMLDHLKLRLADIVTVYRRRYSAPKYFTNIKECIELAKTANNTLLKVSAHLHVLDGDHIMDLWKAAHDIDSTSFSTRERADLVDQLLSTAKSVNLLARALVGATGVSPNKPGRGAPATPYIPIARELIELWEFVTSKPWRGKDLWLAQSFPVAKKGSEEDVEAIQEPAEFCRLVFEMIDPKIKLPKIRTAINNALSIRKALRHSNLNYRFISSTGKAPQFVRYVNISRKQKRQIRRTAS